jgi:hypothetical protein
MARRTTPLDPSIQNRALALAMEWGDDWLTPTQERLARERPELSRAALDAYDRRARSVMTEGHARCARLVAARRGLDVDAAEWRGVMASRFSWIDDENLARLFSQGMYYAYKGAGR